MNYHELYQFGTFELRRNIKHFTKQLNEQWKRRPKNTRGDPITVNDLFKLKWIAHPVITHVHSVSETNSHVLFKSFDNHPHTKKHHDDDSHKNAAAADQKTVEHSEKHPHDHSNKSSASSKSRSRSDSSSGSYEESEESLSVSEEGNKPSHLQIVLTGILPSKEKVVLTFFLEPNLNTTNIHLLPKPWYIMLGELIRC